MFVALSATFWNVRLASAEDAAAASAASATTTTTTPKTLWAQREHILYLRINTPDVDVASITTFVNDTHVQMTARSKATGETYDASLHLFRRIEARTVTWEATSGQVSFIVPKKWNWIYWPRLLRDPKDKYRAYVGIDWKRWKIENEDEESDTLMGPGQDEEWLDEDLAQKKKAYFPNEEKPDAQLPLLNETTFVDFVGKHEINAVLFFDRERRGKHMSNPCLPAYYAFAGLQLMFESDNITLAAVDIRASAKVAKRLHVTHTPVAKLFFKNGDMFQFDPMELKDTKTLGNYLYRQQQEPYRMLHNESHALAYLAKFPKTAMMVLDSDRNLTAVITKKKRTKTVVAEDVFDMSAKGHRAKPDLLPVAYAKLKVPGGLADMPELAEKLNVTNDFQGVVLYKDEEEPHSFVGPWIRGVLDSFLYRMHFNVLEYITPGTFQEYRKRKLPMLYVLLHDPRMDQRNGTAPMLSNETKEEFKALLKDVREVARNYTGRVSFVYTHVERTGDLMDHLRCEFKNASFAVLEDFTEEYRYCVESTDESPLTVDRIKKLVQGYVSQDKNLEPDKVRSEPLPKRNPGPSGVYDVVADNLISFSMDEKVDSVIHFYAAFDEGNDKMDLELRMVSEMLEDVKTIRIGRIDGMKNERPKTFIDPGFFPCTIAFPADRKMMPVFFNKTAGFTRDRLLGWITDMAFFPIHDSWVDPKDVEAAKKVYGSDESLPHGRRKDLYNDWKYPGTDVTIVEYMKKLDDEIAAKKNKRQSNETSSESPPPTPPPKEDL